ncbi:MAG: hypothetical protein ACJ8J0_27250 [Longimicrobiaceae bacterium]
MDKYAQFDVNGSVELRASDKADLIRVATGAGDGEVVLPPASEVLGRRYTITRVSGMGSVYVRPTSDSGDTFNGGDDFTMASVGPYNVTFQAVKTGPGTFGYETVA